MMLHQRVRVRVSTTQAVLFQGRTLVSVSAKGDYLIVNCKRERSSKYEDRLFYKSNVVAFSEGKGEADGAFALVMTDVVLRECVGRVYFFNGECICIKEDGPKDSGSSLVKFMLPKCNDRVRLDVVAESEKVVQQGKSPSDKASKSYVDKTRASKKTHREF